MNESLIYGIATLGAGVLALVVRYGFKSKCSDVSLCFGLIHIQRDIEHEIEEQKMENGRSDSVRNISEV